MKNIFFSLLTITTIGLTGKISGQTNSSLPMTASFQNYVNAGVSPATGIPSINIPIYNLESSDTNFPISVALSYHPYSALDGNPTSEVGLGWSLFKGGSINRAVIGSVDESKNISDITESEADIFYYTIPGYSGKFNIHKSSSGSDLVINNISGTKLKIEYTRDLTSTKLIINSFKITDDKGYQYFFNDYNVGTYSTSAGTKNHKTGFELNQVKDAGNHEIVNFTYDKKVKYIGTSTTLKYQYCKVKDIITSKGKMTFTFDYNSSYDNNSLNPTNDPYSVKNVVLTDKQGATISKYEFVYGMLESTNRSLASLKKLDRNLAVTEQTDFEYNDIYNTDYAAQAGSFCSKVGASNSYIKNLLKKITFPTKGYIIYEFEPNEVYGDRSNANYSGYNYMADPTVQYYGQTVIPYNTANSLTYTFQVNGNSGLQYPVYLASGSNHDGIITDSDNAPPLFTFTVKNASGTIMTRTNAADCNTPNYKLYPGTYTITTNNPPDDGDFVLKQLQALPPPYNNRHVEGSGARIKAIRSYDSDGTLVKTKNYEYNSFTNPLDGTGFMYESELADPTALSTSSFILYKNVKETEVSGTQNNGSIQYSFKIPEDYKDANGNYLFFNLTSQALMEKKEVLNSGGQLQEKTEYEYTISEIPGASGHALTPSYSYIPGFVQYTKETNKTYLNHAPYQTISETTFNPDNFQVSLSKTTAQDGSVTEVSTKYAAELGNTRLLNANIISVPLQIETKTDGTVMTKVTTKYDDTSHFYPTSLESTDLKQTAETQMTFDVYDSKGNLVQTTDKAGNPVTTIWGYYQTLPIAQITGAKYSDIASVSTIAAAINASNADADNPANEAALLTALENLRLDPALQQYPISVSSYDPLVGVTHSVSANGISVSYEYDASGRLLRAKNSEGQVVKENQYNYKH
jgi:YD repeat-containing protein